MRGEAAGTTGVDDKERDGLPLVVKRKHSPHKLNSGTDISDERGKVKDHILVRNFVRDQMGPLLLLALDTPR